uniref:uncharacterized protein LOC113474149 n=1 Tax=Ciona intestinalis TaxID=7719 RepID=UPI000EF4DFED|nr:uncharacterized protein LOC113474149 [Ciona intestinalis]|eukprot:XP_026689774.1 uncharacterized protein LOC113474149 [Ciona intestinalis]
MAACISVVASNEGISVANRSLVIIPGILSEEGLSLTAETCSLGNARQPSGSNVHFNINVGEKNESRICTGSLLLPNGLKLIGNISHLLSKVYMACHNKFQCEGICNQNIVYTVNASAYTFTPQLNNINISLRAEIWQCEQNQKSAASGREVYIIVAVAAGIILTLVTTGATCYRLKIDTGTVMIAQDGVGENENVCEENIYQDVYVPCASVNPCAKYAARVSTISEHVYEKAVWNGTPLYIDFNA